MLKVLFDSQRPRPAELITTLARNPELSMDATMKVIHGLQTLRKSSTFVKFAMGRFLRAVRVVQLFFRRLISVNRAVRQRASREWIKREEQQQQASLSSSLQGSNRATGRVASEAVRDRVVIEEFHAQRKQFAAQWKIWRKTQINLEVQFKDVRQELQDALSKAEHTLPSSLKQLQDRVSYLGGRLQHHEHMMPQFRGMEVRLSSLEGRVAEVLRQEATHRIHSAMESIGVRSEDPRFLDTVVRRYEAVLEAEHAKNRQRRFRQQMISNGGGTAGGSSLLQRRHSSLRMAQADVVPPPTVDVSMSTATLVGADLDRRASQLLGSDKQQLQDQTRGQRTAATARPSSAKSPRMVRLDSLVGFGAFLVSPSNEQQQHPTAPTAASGAFHSILTPRGDSKFRSASNNDAPATAAGNDSLLVEKKNHSSKALECYQHLGLDFDALTTPVEATKKFSSTLSLALKPITVSCMPSIDDAVLSPRAQSPHRLPVEGWAKNKKGIAVKTFRKMDRSPRLVIPVAPTHPRENHAAELRRKQSPTQRPRRMYFTIADQYGGGGGGGEGGSDAATGNDSPKKAQKVDGAVVEEDQGAEPNKRGGGTAAVVATTHAMGASDDVAKPNKKAATDSNLEVCRRKYREAHRAPPPKPPIELPPPIRLRDMLIPTPPPRCETGDTDDEKNANTTDEKPAAAAAGLAVVVKDDDNAVVEPSPPTVAACKAPAATSADNAVVERKTKANTTAAATRLVVGPLKPICSNNPAASAATVSLSTDPISDHHSSTVSHGTVTITSEGRILVTGRRPLDLVEKLRLDTVASSQTSVSNRFMNARGTSSSTADATSGAASVVGTSIQSKVTLPPFSRTVACILVLSTTNANISGQPSSSASTEDTQPPPPLVAVACTDGTLRIFSTITWNCIFSDCPTSQQRAAFTSMCSVNDTYLCAVCEDECVYVWYYTEISGDGGGVAVPSTTQQQQQQASSPVRGAFLNAISSSVSAQHPRRSLGTSSPPPTPRPTSAIPLPSPAGTSLSMHHESLSVFPTAAAATGSSNNSANSKYRFRFHWKAKQPTAITAAVPLERVPNGNGGGGGDPQSGPILIVATFESDVVLWNVEQRTVYLRLEGHVQGVSHILLSRVSRRIITSSLDSTVKLWAVDSKAPKAGSCGSPTSPSSPIPAGDRSRATSVFSAHGGAVQKEVSSLEKPLSVGGGGVGTLVSEASILPLSSMYSMTFEDSSAVDGDNQPTYTVTSFTQHRGSVLCAVEVAGLRAVCTISRDETIRIWDQLTLETSCVITHFPSHLFFGCVSFPRLSLIAVSLSDGSVRVFQTETGKMVHEWQLEHVTQSFQKISSGGLMCVGSSNGQVTILSAETKDVRCVTKLHANGVTSVVTLAGKKGNQSLLQLLSGGEDRMVHVCAVVAPSGL